MAVIDAAYAELHCISNFSFLRGASHPEELVRQADALGYRALALTDECSLAGVVRAHAAARDHDLKLIIGSEFRFDDGLHLVLLAPDRSAYARLSALIALGRSQADKGHYRLDRTDLQDGVPGCLALLVTGPESAAEDADWLKRTFPGRAWLTTAVRRDGLDAERLRHCQRLAHDQQLPAVASGGIVMHRRGRRALQDTLTAIRHGRKLGELGNAVMANGERHLRPRRHIARDYPEAMITESIRIAERCVFRLDELRYEYPEELVPAGHTPASWLRERVDAGARRRWPEGIPERVRASIEHELELIRELAYEPFFLTVDDIVEFARRQGILCQGRGSAANSSVCYCLGITAVDPSRSRLLFERFISRERNEPPDIDVDFEHDRREEVIQYIYRKYGRHRAALAATVICYRPRSAVRDIGKALGLDSDQIDRLTGTLQWWDGQTIDDDRLREAGFDPDNPMIHRLLTLVQALVGFPRHLSQHVGGFVISQGPLSELVPTENAAMAGRSIIQWDKDDLETLGLLKVDCLALGMLSAVRRSLELIERHHGRCLGLADIPAEDPAVYDMLDQADTVGVFQVESRAQMAMLPRLRPRCFYDLVIEISIVRPGPIQGDMVHPYLRRRDGQEAVDYPGEAVRGVLERTLGVPIFQEQVMQLAIVAAGFSPGEADSLRRAMAAWKKRGGLGSFRERLLDGMRARGYAPEFAERLFEQICGFGDYGFPESHAASFALLVYVSAWIKRHYPAVFVCALLNSQPMGFYAPAQLVRDARAHGVDVEGVDVRFSDWDCTLEHDRDPSAHPTLRLGMRLIHGLGVQPAQRLCQSRERDGPFTDVTDLARRAKLDRRNLRALGDAGALAGIGGHRRQAWWQVLGIEARGPLLEPVSTTETAPDLPAPSEAEDLIGDYRSLGLSLGRHPLALLRARLRQRGYRPATELAQSGHRRIARGAGLVINRQRPGAAGGVVFLTLEDETGSINVVVWKDLARRQRSLVVSARLLGVVGIWEQRGDVQHLVAGRLEDHSDLLGELQTRSRDFH
ncbi:error-prone DNA polymerase [Spiribacter vilamensis]|uniref:Error-prone DNA polymerase n=1 Tax=Spiribacter vilamensis TaxID=531306 RepID=A0A4V2GIW7_9GAMM|nr:error-prone DNA polymerase [Spiribacter vilamensis]RZU98085.1 error-prone DNA polymerase [Spiribacter vilamensis]TVO61013.1 error-prone DNA polymerase [Spiribacter vilamensis]